MPKWISRLFGQPAQERGLSRETVLRLLKEEVWEPMRREGWRVRNRKARLKQGEAVLAADFHLIQKDDQRGHMLPINAVMVDAGIYFEYIPNFWTIAPPDRTAAIACPIRHTVKRDKKTKGGEYLNYWFEPDEAAMREALRQLKRDIDERMVPLTRSLADPAGLEEFARTHHDTWMILRTSGLLGIRRVVRNVRCWRSRFFTKEKGMTPQPHSRHS